MKIKRAKTVPLLLGIAVILGMVIGYKIARNIPAITGNTPHSLLNMVIAKIAADYVDSVNEDKLQELAVGEILNKLDPFSTYIPPADLSGIKEQINGSFQGIGVEYVPVGDSPMVLRTIRGGGASMAGILPGDYLLKADTHSLIGVRDIGKFVKGLAGTEVVLTLDRVVQGEHRSYKFAVKRGVVPIRSSHITYAIRAGIGYCKLDRFSVTSHTELRQNLQTLLHQGMRSLILDLRNNGGGVLEAALAIAGEFLPKDKLILYTEDGKHSRHQEYRNKYDGLFKDLRLVVLMNRYSASASEVVAGSLQDWDRAQVIGETSFGKGLVQEQYDLPNRGALRLTIARYYTPLGRCIQKNYLGKKHSKAQILNTDSTLFRVDTFLTPKGKKVFSSGGIRPDIQISQPLTIALAKGDTSDFLKVLGNKNFRLQLLRNLANQYSKWHQLYRSPRQFWREFQTPEPLLNQVLAELKPPVRASLRSSVAARLKLDLLSLLFAEQEYLPILLEQDPVIRASLDYLTSNAAK